LRAAYLLVVLLLVGLVPVSASLTVPTQSVPEPVALRGILEGFARPAHAPVPETNVGIGPGAYLVIEIPDAGTFACTSNFVWTTSTKTYLGAAGHCFLPEGKTATHGPGADYNADGVRVWACVYGCSFGGLSGQALPGIMVELGRVAYARQEQGGVAVGNDFGVVEIPSVLPANVAIRPSLPVWGGPTTSTQGSASGVVCQYGSGLLVGESFATMARAGYGLGAFSDGSWNAAIPINSGDSGSALVGCGIEGTNGSGGFHGRAPVGIVTHGIGVPVVGLGVPGYGAGTTITKAKLMATQASLSIELVIES
jgi:hypothetical protein